MTTTVGGNSPQLLVNEVSARDRPRRGRRRAARRRRVRAHPLAGPARAQGVARVDPGRRPAVPDGRSATTAPVPTTTRWRTPRRRPRQIYPLFETALRAANGRDGRRAPGAARASCGRRSRRSPPTTRTRGRATAGRAERDPHGRPDNRDGHLPVPEAHVRQHRRRPGGGVAAVLLRGGARRRRARRPARVPARRRRRPRPLLLQRARLAVRLAGHRGSRSGTRSTAAGVGDRRRRPLRPLLLLPVGGADRDARPRARRPARRRRPAAHRHRRARLRRRARRTTTRPTRSRRWSTHAGATRARSGWSARSAGTRPSTRSASTRRRRRRTASRASTRRRRRRRSTPCPAASAPVPTRAARSIESTAVVFDRDTGPSFAHRRPRSTPDGRARPRQQP